MHKSLASLIVFLLAVIAVAVFGRAFPPGDWYASLIKPVWTPPNWLFPPVWTLLYALMALAAWRVWRFSQGGERQSAITWWLIQLLLNAAWSWLFFGLNRTGWALGEIALLWLALLVTALKFRSIDRLAFLMLLPYLAWVSFAAILNYALWSMNGGGFG